MHQFDASLVHDQRHADVLWAAVAAAAVVELARCGLGGGDEVGERAVRRVRLHHQAPFDRAHE
jgi:hypothetical protein